MHSSQHHYRADWRHDCILRLDSTAWFALVLLAAVAKWWLPFFCGVHVGELTPARFADEYADNVTVLRPVRGHAVVPDAQHSLLHAALLASLVASAVALSTLSGSSSRRYHPWSFKALVDWLNQLTPFALDPIPTAGIESDYSKLLFIITLIFGLLYVLATGLSLAYQEQHQLVAKATIITRLVFFAIIFKAVYADSTISSGFVLFAIQDAVTALITTSLLVRDAKAKARLTLNHKKRQE
ncbi:hypothetical protein BDR26DRAFT_1005419 [Obelidium mucronatum]|nr:hypothetical protein BDR26DRAFT_1005419 [Obelidium mucronatum]